MTSWHKTNLREVCNFVSFIIAAEAFSNFTYKSLFSFYWKPRIYFFIDFRQLRKRKDKKTWGLHFPKTVVQQMKILKKYFFSEQYNPPPHISISIFWNPKWAHWAHITGEKFVTIPGKNLERVFHRFFFFKVNWGKFLKIKKFGL